MDIVGFETTPFATNCLVLREKGQAVVVDPGEVRQDILDALDGCTLHTVVNTHAHCDHCGGNAELIRRTGATLACHREDLGLLRSIEQQGAMFGVPFPPSPDPGRLLEEGDVIVVGDSQLTVFHTPGHSPGHIVLVGDGYVIAGDVLFAGSIGRTDLPGGNQARLLESIRSRLLNLPDDTLVYPGHGPTTTIAAERRSNPFLAGLESP